MLKHSLMLTRFLFYPLVLQVFLVFISFVAPAISETKFVKLNLGLLGQTKSSLAWGDYNNDGYPDLAACGKIDGYPYRQCILYKNVNGTKLVATSDRLRAASTGSIAWGDYDQDGYFDLAIMGIADLAFSTTLGASVYHNELGENFSSAEGFAPLAFGSIAFADLNGDRYPEVLISGQGKTLLTETYIYWNNSGAGFSEQSLAALAVSMGSFLAADFDKNGEMDLLLTGASLESCTSIIGYQNNKSFSFSTSALDQKCSPAYMADYDLDGYPDIVFAGPGSPRLFRNNGNRTFSVAADFSGVSGDYADWGDYDRDGYADLVIVGKVGSEYVTRIYHNDGGRGFSDINAAIGNIADGAVSWGDFNADGYLDLAISGDSSVGPVLEIYQNITKLPPPTPIKTIAVNTPTIPAQTLAAKFKTTLKSAISTAKVVCKAKNTISQTKSIATLKKTMNKLNTQRKQFVGMSSAAKKNLQKVQALFKKVLAENISFSQKKRYVSQILKLLTAISRQI